MNRQSMDSVGQLATYCRVNHLVLLDEALAVEDGRDYLDTKMVPGAGEVTDGGSGLGDTCFDKGFELFGIHERVVRSMLSAEEVGMQARISHRPRHEAR